MPLPLSAEYHVEHIGSLLRPRRLIEHRYSDAARDKASLWTLECECIRQVVQLQEKIGLQIVSDGEFRRESWRSSFIGCVDGIEHRDEQAHVNAAGYVDMGSFVMDASPFVTGKIRRLASGIAIDEFTYLKSVTDKTPKIALPAPSFMHFFQGKGAIDRSVYPDLQDFYADLVRVYVEELQALANLGAEYVQLDEAPLGFLCDQGVRSRMQADGIDAFEWVDLYVSMINDVVEQAPASLTVGVHICRGNSMGRSGGAGSFEPVASRVFGKLKAHRLLLEFDEPHNGDLAPLRFVPPHMTVVLGLVSTKVKTVEQADWLRQRIRDVEQYIPLNRLSVSPQCGFSSRDKGTSLTVEEEVAKLELLARVAKDVWGSA